MTHMCSWFLKTGPIFTGRVLGAVNIFRQLLDGFRRTYILLLVPTLPGPDGSMNTYWWIALTSTVLPICEASRIGTCAISWQPFPVWRKSRVSEDSYGSHKTTSTQTRCSPTVFLCLW